ncbi:trypsin-1 [Procambarus clarkii]|uniref:trypsin-1 n=1 Tax=Procambarus clarkii TaxID=6728 RepID=UPI001E678419|nr:trypsin-1-like [Procambarus clarkii]
MGWQTTSLPSLVTGMVGVWAAMGVWVAVVGGVLGAEGRDMRSNLCVKPKMDCDPDLPRYPAQDKITDGQIAEPGSTPWLVSLQDAQYLKPAHFCGGTLLSHLWVLTTASCVSGYRDSSDFLQVVVGEYDMSVQEGWERTRNVWKVEVHPRYDEYTHDFDVALVEMLFPVGFNERIRPLPLPNRKRTCQHNISFYRHSHVNAGLYFIAGWGKRGETGDISNVILDAYTPIVPYEDCINAYPNQITDSMLCAGNVTSGGLQPCHGDWGGALVSKDGIVVGLASWSSGCGRPGYPGVYTDVTAVVDWICGVITFWD